MTDRARLFIALLFAALTLVRPAQAQSVTYGTRTAAGVRAHVITVDMNDPNVKVAPVVPASFPGTDEAFTSLVKRSGAVAAINGTFFDKYNLLPIGDIVADGQVLREGRMGTAMAVTPKNKVLFGRVTPSHSADWTGYEAVLACGPTLVKGGRVDLKAAEEGFHDPHVMGAANRSAVGLTAGNRLLLVCVTSGVTLSKLAEVMKALGCVEAMNLDGGGSMAMSYRGRVVLPAGRKLTNILAVYEKGKHLELPQPVALPEGNGSQPLSESAPRPSLLAQEGLLAAAAAKPAPDWFVPYPNAEARGEANGVGAVYHTADSVAQVAAFYRERFGKDADVQTTRYNGNFQGIVYLVSGPGAGSQILLERGEGSPETTLSALFCQPGVPKPPRIQLPKPYVASTFEKETEECSVHLAKPPAGVPVYPGTKRMPSPDAEEVTYLVPASYPKVLAFCKAKLGTRARVSTSEKLKGFPQAAVRILSGPGAGTLLVLVGGVPNQTLLTYYRSE